MTQIIDDINPTGKVKYKDAPTGVRFVNFLIDQALLVGIPYFLILKNGIDRDEVTNFRVAFILLFFLYYFLMELMLGQTLGKIITGTKVVTTLKREKPSAGQIAGRTVCRLIPFEPLSGFAYPWHDTITGTTVVFARPV